MRCATGVLPLESLGLDQRWDMLVGCMWSWLGATAAEATQYVIGCFPSLCATAESAVQLARVTLW